MHILITVSSIHSYMKKKNAWELVFKYQILKIPWRHPGYRNTPNPWPGQIAYNAVHSRIYRTANYQTKNWSCPRCVCLLSSKWFVYLATIIVIQITKLTKVGQTLQISLYDICAVLNGTESDLFEILNFKDHFMYWGGCHVPVGIQNNICVVISVICCCLKDMLSPEILPW